MSCAVERHIILVTGGPPCKDYSGIKQRGCTGCQGRRFDVALFIRDEITHQWPNQTVTLLENVVPHTDVLEDFSQLYHNLGLQPVLINAANGHVQLQLLAIVSRPVTSEQAIQRLVFASSANGVFGCFVIAQLKVCACQPWSKDDRGDQCCPRLEETGSGAVRRTSFWPDLRAG